MSTDSPSNNFQSSHPEQGEQGDKLRNDAELFWHKHRVTFKGVNGGDYIDKEDWDKFINTLCKLSSPPPEGQDDPVAFVKWIGCKFFYDDESELWETIPEGKTYDFNGQKQFRFTSDELYKLFKMQKDFIGDPDECTGAFEGQ